MSNTNFLHGVRTIEYDDGTEEISTVNVSVIGIVGTAPDAQSATKAKAITGSGLLKNELQFNAYSFGVDGNRYSIEIKDGTAVETADAVTYNYLMECFSISLNPDGFVKVIFLLPVLESAENKYFLTAADIVRITKTDIISKQINGVTYGVGASLPENTDGTGLVYTYPETQLSGGADEAFPYNKPIVIAGSTTKAAKLGSTGTLPLDINDIFNQAKALIVVVRVRDDADPLKLQQNVIAGLNQLPTSGQLNEVMPRIIIAPDFSAIDSVAAQVEIIANKVRGVGYIDSPSFASAQEVALRRQNYGKRVEILRPRVFTSSSSSSTSRAYSACAAGLRCRIDNENGFWWSKSNQQIMGVTALEQVDEYIIGDDTCIANLLNANQVSTIIRRSGFKHWGNYLCSTDPQWAFECVRRTADVIEDSVAETVQDEFVDRPIDVHLGTDIVETINGFIRELFEMGAINGGNAWLDPELNTKESLAAGKLYINVEFAPKSPAQTVIITYRINNDYTVEQFAELLKAA